MACTLAREWGACCQPFSGFLFDLLTKHIARPTDGARVILRRFLSFSPFFVARALLFSLLFNGSRNSENVFVACLVRTFHPFTFLAHRRTG